MSLPRRVNITIYKGSTFTLPTINAVDSSGDPVDLTGCLVYSEVRRFPEDPNSYDLAPVIDEDSIDGEVSDENTDVMDTGRFEWDVLLENPAGKRLLIVKGNSDIKGIATQPA